MKDRLFASTAALILASTGLAQAQDNMQKLENMQTTGTGSDAFQFVPQDDENAAQLRKNLENVKLPDGFKINLYAVVPDARHMAVGPQGIVTFVGTRKDAVWAVTDRNKDGTADEVKRFAPSLEFAIPNGVCFSKDGFLYIAERNRVRTFPAAEFFYESPDVAVGDVVKEGELIPGADESFNHTARVCAVGPDKKIYIQIGQPFNVPSPEKQEEFKKSGIGGIIRMDQNGANREIFADGLRNPVGFDFDPATGDLWTNDNQVDGMGDDTPPGELNRVTEMGQNFGFPWYGGGKVRTEEYKNSEPPADVVFPVVETIAHAADLGMVFYTGRKFPDRYKQGVFTAQHGSWNRTDPAGARVLFTPLNEDGTAGEQEEFAAGWLTADGEYIGRPTALTQLRDGSLLVSDDFAGAIYRISYGD
ncbi:PQQ-dependent sugar dehydrogenase [Mesorhizobium sp. YM1C-6-2]|uniref:PQQ-dependent sugar dehydrogenase n=1 Tax=Mesorhizobium sp. YM1C-6-2 TaxID=1827501 RepID=UPI000EF1E679|nr:PQQ-dependent sugar dehydrogenase [Mesorhizobium sp. YM1C-6-2]RLP24656.1 sorbosone dehydrogenase [Mesorhizobium sp. YM1C-6-2]